MAYRYFEKAAEETDRFRVVKTALFYCAFLQLKIYKIVQYL